MQLYLGTIDLILPVPIINSIVLFYHELREGRDEKKFIFVNHIISYNFITGMLIFISFYRLVLRFSRLSARNNVVINYIKKHKEGYSEK